MPARSGARADRLGLILDRLGGGEPLRATSLARELGVSTATVRRDLNLLDARHLLARVHGGARPNRSSEEIPVRYRSGIRRASKQRIAAAAATLLPCGPITVGLNGGTTARAVAAALSRRAELTVVTNALDLAAELYRRPLVRVVVTGGLARPLSGELVGPLVARTLEPMRLTALVLGVDGVAAESGLTTHDAREAEANAAMIASAARVIVVADSSKLGRTLPALIAPIAAAHDLVTDGSADPDVVRALRAAGVRVHVV